jgi:chromate transporter
VIALIVRAVHKIADHTLNDRLLWAIALASAAATALGVRFWIVLPAGLAYAAGNGKRYGLALLVIGVAALAAVTIGGDASTSPGGAGNAAGLAPHGSVSALPLFLSGLKAGLLTFGGAYTAIPFVRSDAVGRGWVSDTQFLDALALGGIIPAPLVIFTTFIGYLAGGLAGALAITAGVFLPAFAFALLFYVRLERAVEDERIHRLLEGVAAGVVGLVAVTAIQLGLAVARSVPSLLWGALLFAAALLLLYRWRSRLAVPAVVLGSGFAGIALFA